MRLLIIFSLLLTTLCAAPANETVVDLTNDKRTNNEKFLGLLKETGTNIRKHLEGVFEAKWKDVVVAVLKLSNNGTWQDVVLSLFEGEAETIMKDFLDVVKGNKEKYDGLNVFFKEQWDEIVTEISLFFGARGSDLFSVLANLLDDALYKLLTTFARKLERSEIDAISSAVGGAGITIAEIMQDKKNIPRSLFDYFRNKVATLVKVLLKRVIDENGATYKAIEKTISVILPKDRE
ncbi:hypothetical protein SprV_0401652300 [Sparganum proliferum]